MDCWDWNSPNQTIGFPESGAQRWQFQESLEKHAVCAESTYLRPDIAGSIVPWPYTLAWLLIHAPLVLIRVARWERVQALSLLLAAGGIAFAAQAYASTGRKPEDILVWTPLMLILDVGAVMQLFFLVVEDAKGESTNGFVPLGRAFVDLMARIFTGRRRVPGPVKSIALARQDTDKDQGTAVQVEVVQSSPPLSPSDDASTDTVVEAQQQHQLSPPLPLVVSSCHNHCGQHHDDKIVAVAAVPHRSKEALRRKALVVLLSALLFVGLVALQILGLVSAVRGLAGRDELQASWCSPMFQAFVLAVADGNCRLHPVATSASKGIGCIKLQGDQQAGWLVGTAVALAVSLALEFADLLVLALVESRTRWRNVKMRRPWCTMFAGIAILGVYLIYGSLSASRLPSGMTEAVWVFRREPSLSIATVCRGTVTPAGVRGSIMGWTDGFLSSWGRVYFG